MPGFTLKGKIQLDGSQWQAGLAQAKNQADRWSTEVAGMIKGRLAAAFAVGAIVRQATASLDQAGRIRDKSNALGISTDLYQQLEFAAEQSGASIENMAAAIQRLGGAQLNARQGSKAILEVFKEMGVSAKEMNEAAPADLFFKLAEVFKTNPNDPRGIGFARTLLGRSGAELLPAFRAGLGSSAQLAKDAGVIIPEDEVMRLAAASDTKTTAEFKGRAVSAGVTASAVEHATSPFGVFRNFGAMLADVNSAVKEFREYRREALKEQRGAREAAQQTAENTKTLRE